MENISDPNVKIGIKTEEDNVLPKASVFERAIAFVIDVMLWVTISTLLYKLFHINSNTVYAIISVIVFIIYITIGTAGKMQTVGKFLLGIKVINRKTKDNLTLMQAFLRAIGYLISMFTLGIGFVFVFFSPKRLALEDLISGSEVITIRPKTPSELTFISFLGAMLIIGAAYLVYNNLIFNPYKAMKDAANLQLIKIALLEEQHKERYGVYTNDLLRLALLSGDAVQFQRDMQNNFRPNGFKIAVNEKGYLIEGYAKDNSNPEKSSLVRISK